MEKPRKFWRVQHSAWSRSCHIFSWSRRIQNEFVCVFFMIWTRQKICLYLFLRMFLDFPMVQWVQIIPKFTHSGVCPSIPSPARPTPSAIYVPHMPPAPPAPVVQGLYPASCTSYPSSPFYPSCEAHVPPNSPAPASHSCMSSCSVK